MLPTLIRFVINLCCLAVFLLLYAHEELSNGVKICLKKGEKAMPMNHTSTTPLEDLAAGRAVNSSNQCLKVFVQRDYSEGTLVKFQTRFPSELEDRIERQAFEYTVNQLNAIYAEAEKAGCSTYCEGCMACLTAYLVYLCTETHYEKCLRKVAKFVVEQNERVYAPRGLLITDPTERGLRVVTYMVQVLLHLTYRGR